MTRKLQETKGLLQEARSQVGMAGMVGSLGGGGLDGQHAAAGDAEGSTGCDKAETNHNKLFEATMQAQN